MRDLIDQIRKNTPAGFDFEWLGKFVRNIDCTSLDLTGLVPEFDANSGNYARNILLMEPFEVVILHWPPGVESAIHHHEGFWGYVLCVEGEVENVEYTFDAETQELRERSALCVKAGGVLPEPDGTIHKIVNPSSDQPLVTVHFYAPALEDLDGMVLYDAERCWRGELNEKATTASFNQDEQGFRSLQKDAFSFVPLNATPGNETHRLYPLIPKPSNGEILDSISRYYAEQAASYDDLDGASMKRSRYTARIDEILAADLKEIQPERVLHIACGTGRRALGIRDASQVNYTVEGVDISASMVEQARQRGVQARIGVWNECGADRGAYDAVTFLYAFGHIPSEKERRESLDKVFSALKPGGRFYFDVFNLDNANEWGPEALRTFKELKLSEEGYEQGDLFYKRHNGTSVSFLHYFTQDGITDMVEACGFDISGIHRIGYVEKCGKSLALGEEGGNFLIIAEKPH
ncbi:MAG: methyltransferase domain-containing protein [Flavobacteriales bacterium]|nr:methyltransferase domain-containing protein [Flavobacteriales bacterium]